MHLHIRPFASGDYTAMLAIHLAIFPDHKFTEDEMLLTGLIGGKR